jgi:hypothetical protein
MASFNKIQAFAEHVYEGVHNLGSNTLKVLLTNDAPSAAADAVKADLTSELSTANGYTAGGTAPSISSSAQTSGTYKLVLADVVFTASGGSIGPFRYPTLWNDTPSSPADPLIGWWDYGSALTLADGESLTVDFDATNGVLQHV